MSKPSTGCKLSWLAALLFAAGCSAEPMPPNVLLVSIDTLRADHLGVYGYDRDTSPNLDLFAATATRFEYASAPTPWTLPSHVAMLSGSHPYDVAILGVNSSIPESVPMLAEGLAAQGYQTAAYVDSSPKGFLGASRGFSRGFDSYAHAPHSDRSAYKYDMQITVDAALEWLRKRDASRPFFLFLHTKSVHATARDDELIAISDAPYDSPQPFRGVFLPDVEPRFSWTEGEDAGVAYLRTLNDRIGEGALDPTKYDRKRLEELIALYDGGISFVDFHFGHLLEGLKELGLEDDTIVVVTSDHGEGFLEHQFFLHKEVYTSHLHVPLMIRDPRGAGPAVLETRVSLMDIAPTILHLVGLQPDEVPGGRALSLQASESSASSLPLPLFSFFHFQTDYMYEAYALDDGRHRLIHHKLAQWGEFRTELFDTRSDPGETRPIQGEPERKQAMLATIFERLERGRTADGDQIELDPETIDHLRSLGYLD